MSQRRVIAGISLALAGTLALAACSGNSAEPPTSTEDIAGTITVAWQDSEAPGLEPIIAAFEEEYPEVTVELEPASIADYFVTLPTELSSGSGPDVFLVWGAWGNSVAEEQLAQYGYLEDLSGEPWVADIPESIAYATQADGSTYTLPTTLVAQAPWYNMEALAEVGLEPPTDFDSLIKFCADAQAAGKIPYGISASALSSQGRGFAIFAAGLIGDQSMADVMEPLMSGEEKYADSDVFREGLEQYQEMIEAGCFPPDALAWDQERENQALVKGEALGAMSGSNLKAAWSALDPDGTFEVHPVTERVLLYNNKGMAVNANSDNKEAALAFLDFFSQPENRSSFAFNLAGVLPAFPVEEAPEDVSLAFLSEKLAAGDAVGFYQHWWDNPELDSVWSSTIQGMFLGESTPEDVLNALDTAQQSFLN